MGDKVYKPIVKEGDHLLRSKDNPNHVRGLTRDSENKNPDIIEWEEYDLDDLQSSAPSLQPEYQLTPEQQQAAEEISEAVVRLVIVGSIFLLDRVVIPWWKRSAWPWLRDRGQDIKGFFPRGKRNSIPDQPASSTELIRVTDQIDDAFEQFSLTEEEAQQHLMMMIFHMLGLANEIRILSNARIAKETKSKKQCIERQRETEKYLSERVAFNIDRLLADPNIHLDLETARELFVLTGGGVRLNGEYVPVQPAKINEALHRTKECPKSNYGQ